MAVIYRNASIDTNHWIQLNVSSPDNSFGLESKVTLYKAGTKQVIGYDEVRTDFCYRSKKSPMLHFGLGSDTEVDVKVRSRSGIETSFEKLSADQVHTLRLIQP